MGGLVAVGPSCDFETSINDISALFLGSCRERATGECCPFVPRRGEGIERLWTGDEVVAEARSYSAFRPGGYLTRDEVACSGSPFSVEPESVSSSKVRSESISELTHKQVKRSWVKLFK